eukprot:643581-Amphidinium_carterae.1
MAVLKRATPGWGQRRPEAEPRGTPPPHRPGFPNCLLTSCPQPPKQDKKTTFFLKRVTPGWGQRRPEAEPRGTPPPHHPGFIAALTAARGRACRADQPAAASTLCAIAEPRTGPISAFCWASE